MATFYLAIYPAGASTPTWNRANVGTNDGWSGSPVYHDADTDPGTGGTYQFTPDASGLTAGTPYDAYAVWDDGATTVGPVQGMGFTTAAASVEQDLAASGTATATGTGTPSAEVTLAGAGSALATGTASITGSAALPTPAGLAGTPAANSIAWAWSAVSGAAGYEIECGPVGGPYSVADTGASTSYEQGGLSGSMQYEARVRAYA